MVSLWQIGKLELVDYSCKVTFTTQGYIHYTRVHVDTHSALHNARYHHVVCVYSYMDNCSMLVQSA